VYAWLVTGVFFIELVLEAALIPWWGYWGACAGSVIGEVFFTTAGLICCRRLGFGGIDWKSLAQATFAAAAMALLLLAFHDRGIPLLAVGVVLGLALYLALCLAFGALRLEEVQRLWVAVAGLCRSAKPAVTVVSVRPQIGEAAETLALR